MIQMARESFAQWADDDHAKWTVDALRDLASSVTGFYRAQIWDEGQMVSQAHAWGIEKGKRRLKAIFTEYRRAGGRQDAQAFLDEWWALAEIETGPVIETLLKLQEWLG